MGQNLNPTVISKNSAVATEFFKAFYAIKSKKTKYPGGSTGFVPYTIDFSLDGISGIKIYDKLHIDTSFLPIGYPTTSEFIVTGIDHSLKDGDWETNIKVVLIPKFENLEEPITAEDSNLIAYKQPPTPTPPSTPSPSIPSTVTISNIKITSTEGPATGVYHSPAKEASPGEYVDASKTVNKDTLQKLAKANNGLYPINFYTKPGDTSGTLYAKVVSKNGSRNVYEPSTEFNAQNIVNWSYKGKSGFSKSASLNKLWVPTLTQMAQALDNADMWNANHIKEWAPGILLRDVTPASGIVYGQISGHAFGMAIDINYSAYPLGKQGALNWNRDIAAGVPTAKVHKLLNENFVLKQGGAQPVFWLYPGDSHHFSVYIKV